MSRYKIYSEQVTSQDIENFIESTGAVQVHERYGHLLKSRSKRKKRDKQMHFIVRVRDRAVKALGSRSQVKEQEF